MTTEPQNILTTAREKKSEKPQECPLCHKESTASFRPFCSKKCKMIDLYKWVSGHYVIPGDPAEILEKEEEEAKEEWEKAWKKEDF
jgi:endogenous inhibitor of DNA gyrase (YacG/DUF329 family)